MKTNNKVKLTHTPTPWRVAEYKIDGRFVIETNTEELAYCPTDSDAAFIVRAVNEYDFLKANHEALLQMLAHVESWLREPFFDATMDKRNSKADEIAHAIAAAEKRE